MYVARWVQSVKGDDVRCRLVAQEVVKDPREHLLADTRPLFAARLLSSRTATSAGRKWTLGCLVCIFLCGRQEVCIDIPTEDPARISGDMVGKLHRASYGTRDAPPSMA